MGTKSTRSAGTQFTPKGVTQGNILVCPKTGNPIDSVVDGSGITRLAVDASLTVSNVSVNVDVDYTEDSVHIGDPNTDNTLLINSDGSIDSNVEVDAADGDNIAVSAHPDQIFDENIDTITTSAFENIYTYVSSNNRTKIQVVEGYISTPSLVRLKIDGAIKKQFWTSPLERNFKFVFEEHRSLLSGVTLTVEAKVDRLIFSSYDTFTSLEGYLN